MDKSKFRPLEDAKDGAICNLKNAKLSPCGRILVESQETNLLIRDTSSFSEVYRYEGNANMLLLSSNFCLFEGENDQDEKILGLINFQQQETSKF